MIEKGISAPLAAALTAKGYQTLTAVQEAVLKPEAQGRDMLVSAQTGSGKTVAFGIAIADQILQVDQCACHADAVGPGDVAWRPHGREFLLVGA